MTKKLSFDKINLHIDITMLIIIIILSTKAGLPVDYISLLFTSIQTWVVVKGDIKMTNLFDWIVSGACGVDSSTNRHLK